MQGRPQGSQRRKKQVSKFRKNLGAGLAAQIMNDGGQVLFGDAAFQDAKLCAAKRGFHFCPGVLSMVTFVNPFPGAQIKKIVEIIVYTSTEKQFKPVVKGGMIRGDYNEAPAWNEDAINFSQHSFRRKRMVLHDVGVGNEIELIVGERQRLSAYVAFLILNSEIAGNLREKFSGRSIIDSGGAALQFHRVNSQGTELRSDIQKAWRNRARRNIFQDVTQDLNFPHAGSPASPNPIGEISRHPRIAGDPLENSVEAIEGGALFPHSGKNEVYTSHAGTGGGAFHCVFVPVAAKGHSLR